MNFQIRQSGETLKDGLHGSAEIWIRELVFSMVLAIIGREKGDADHGYANKLKIRETILRLRHEKRIPKS